MEFGREIAVNGVRPGWVTDDDVVKVVGLSEREWGPYRAGKINAEEILWHQAKGIRLPADHWVYRVLDWNDAHPDQEPFEPWAGGDAAPADWDGGEVLWRDGKIGDTVATAPCWNWHMCTCDDNNLIGYRRKRTAAAQPDMVQVRRMTEAEAQDFISGVVKAGGPYSSLSMDTLAALGIIREPTEAERIAEATGLTVDVVQKVLEARDAS